MSDQIVTVSASLNSGVCMAISWIFISISADCKIPADSFQCKPCQLIINIAEEMLHSPDLSEGILKAISLLDMTKIMPAILDAT